MEKLAHALKLIINKAQHFKGELASTEAGIVKW